MEVSRFRDLNKDILINILETLSYKYVFSYDSSKFKISIQESSTTSLLFSVNIDSLTEFTRLEAFINLLSGKVERKILEEKDPNVSYYPDFSELKNGEWIAGICISEIDYDKVYLGLKINAENKVRSLEIYVRGIEEGVFNLSLPVEKCNIPNLKGTLERILTEEKRKDEEWKKKKSERNSDGYGYQARIQHSG